MRKNHHVNIETNAGNVTVRITKKEAQRLIREEGVVRDRDDPYRQATGSWSEDTNGAISVHLYV